MSVTSLAALAAIIDHTILRPEATEADVERFCAEAVQWNFAAVCVNPLHVPRAAAALRGSSVKTCSVIGFPLGATPTELKRHELEWVLAAGATEVDMVIAIGTLKSAGADPIGDEVGVIKTDCGRVPLKVILETCLLSDEEKVKACELSKKAGADFVKTSTGFSTGGATVHDIELMRKTVGPKLGVKASGGIHSQADAKALIAAGATRIGASAGIKIVRGDAPESGSTGKTY